jgi:hypothetical protein
MPSSALLTDHWQQILQRNFECQKSVGMDAAAGTVIGYFGSSRPPGTSTRLPLPNDIVQFRADNITLPHSLPS